MNRKLIRGLGIALIALPDPTFITDILGLMIVSASFLSAERTGPDSQCQPDGLMRSYLECLKDGKPGFRPPAHVTLRCGPAYRQPGKAAVPAVYHPLDRKSLRERYSANSDENRQQKTPDVYHRLDRQNLRERYTTESSEFRQREAAITMTVYHRLDWRSLLERFDTFSRECCPMKETTPTVYHQLEKQNLRERYAVASHQSCRQRAAAVQIIHHKLNWSLASA
jgi:hypothetical protein